MSNIWTRVSMLESGKKLTNGFCSAVTEQLCARAATGPWTLDKENICSSEFFPNRILFSKEQNLAVNETQLPETVRCPLS